MHLRGAIIGRAKRRIVQKRNNACLCCKRVKKRCERVGSLPCFRCVSLGLSCQSPRLQPLPSPAFQPPAHTPEPAKDSPPSMSPPPPPPSCSYCHRQDIVLSKSAAPRTCLSCTSILRLMEGDYDFYEIPNLITGNQ
mmetsp:Transcript_7771/g.14775  ORF Transcript_7771/g.14775 Transcript_7771/m.14775 type:complete len:137 (-) Transcript_7771:3609-4019(-)